MEERRDKDSGDIYLEEAILQVREETRKKAKEKDEYHRNRENSRIYKL